MFNLSHSLRLILVGLVVLSSFPCDGLPAGGKSSSKSIATSTSKAPPKTTSTTGTSTKATSSTSTSTFSKPTSTTSKSTSTTSNSTSTSTKPTGTNTTTSPGTTSNSTAPACPVKTGQKPGKTRSLYRRAGPEDASKDITLYHGTDPGNVAQLKKGVDLTKTEEHGDFSDNYGFYLTDRMRAAGQFVCHNPDKPATSVSILEYKWAGSGQKIYQWRDKSKEWEEFCGINNNPDFYRPKDGKKTTTQLREWADGIIGENVMISGPMETEDDKDLTKDFWQYALIDEKAVGKLTLVTVHENIPCSKFPKGELNPTDSQGPSADFSDTVKTELGITSC